MREEQEEGAFRLSRQASPKGSADDGKRSALDVLVDRGYQGDSSIQSFGLATPVGVGSLGFMFFLASKIRPYNLLYNIRFRSRV